jgi:hypothetical protein
MGHEMRQRSGGGRRCTERKKSQDAEPARDWRTERKQPYQIEDQVIEVGMKERIGDEGPNPRSPPIR